MPKIHRGEPVTPFKFGRLRRLLIILPNFITVASLMMVNPLPVSTTAHSILPLTVSVDGWGSVSLC